MPDDITGPSITGELDETNRCPMVGAPTPGDHRLSLDLCLPVRMVAAIRADEHRPTMGEGEEGWSPGYWEPMSEHPIRATARINPNGEHPCRHHFGRIAVRDDGYWVAAMCSDPGGMEAARKNHVMNTVVKREAAEGTASIGQWFFAGGFRNQYWTEAHLHSGRVYCGGIT